MYFKYIYMNLKKRLVSVSACVSAHTHVGALKDQLKELAPLELEWVLETELRSSVREASAFNL